MSLCAFKKEALSGASLYENNRATNRDIRMAHSNIFLQLHLDEKPHRRSQGRKTHNGIKPTMYKTLGTHPKRSQEIQIHGRNTMKRETGPRPIQRTFPGVPTARLNILASKFHNPTFLPSPLTPTLQRLTYWYPCDCPQIFRE